MGPTQDDIHPTGLDGRTDYVALAKVWAKVIAIVGASLIAIITSAVAAYRAAVADAAVKTQAVVAKATAQVQSKPEAQLRKDESEAAFQAMLKWKGDIDRRLPLVERAVAKAAGRKPAKVTAKPFPTSTAQALQEARGASPPTMPPATTDATTP